MAGVPAAVRRPCSAASACSSARTGDLAQARSGSRIDDKTGHRFGVRQLRGRPRPMNQRNASSACRPLPAKEKRHLASRCEVTRINDADGGPHQVRQQAISGPSLRARVRVGRSPLQDSGAKPQLIHPGAGRHQPRRWPAALYSHACTRKCWTARGTGAGTQMTAGGLFARVKVRTALVGAVGPAAPGSDELGQPQKLQQDK